MPDREQSQVTAITVDRRITMTFVITLLAQIFLGGWFAAGANSELKWLKENMAVGMVNRYTRTEADLNNKSFLRRISALESMNLTQLARLRELEMGLANRNRGGS